MLALLFCLIFLIDEYISARISFSKKKKEKKKAQNMENKIMSALGMPLIIVTNLIPTTFLKSASRARIMYLWKLNCGFPLQ